MRHHAVLGNDHDAVADEVERVVHVLRLALGRDGHVVPDARVLINDGVLDARVLTDADARLPHRLVLRDGGGGLVVVAAQHDGAV